MIEPLPAAIDLSNPGTTAAQKLIAFVIIFAAALGVLYLLYRTHYSGLPQSLKRAKADLRGARADTTLSTIYLSAEEAADPAHVRAAVADVLEAEADDPTPRDAARSVREELAATWVPRFEQIPSTARRVGVLAVVVAVFGAIAVSTEAFITILTAQTPGLDPTKWPLLAVSETAAVISHAGDTISTLPVVGTVWSLAFAFAILLWEWLYSHWYAVALALAAGAVGLTLLDRRLDETDPARWVDELPDPAAVARLGAAAVGGVWGITLVGIAIGRLSGPPALGVRYGLVAGVMAVAVFCVAGIGAAYRWRETLPQLRWREADRDTRRYLLVRAFALALAVLVGPLVPVWVGVGLMRLPRLATAFLAADAPIKAVVLLAVVAVLAVLVHEAREAWGDVRDALQITMARQQVRSVVVAGGVPVAIVAVVYALVAGITKSILLGVGAAIVAGLIARTAIRALTRAKYKATFLAGGGPTPSRRVVIEGAPLETRGGEHQAYLRINGGTELLHPDRDQLADAAVAVVGDLVDDGEARATVPEWHAQFAFDVGITDPEETALKLYERAAKRVYTGAREHGRMLPREYVADEIEDLPDQVAALERSDTFFDREERRGSLRIRRDYIEVLDDPRARIWD